MAKWLKDNAVGLIGLFLTFGSGIVAFVLGAWEMVVAYPFQSILLTVSAFFLGILAFRFFEIHSRCTRDKRTLQIIKGLPPQLISVIRHTYLEGAYAANIFDSTVQYLLELGYLSAPSTVPTLYQTQFILQPWFKTFLDRYHDQVFDKE